MKKRIGMILLSLMLWIPLGVNAASVSISGVSISGGNEATVNRDFSLSFLIKFSGLQKGSMDSQGVYAAGFHLDYDDTIFYMTGISSNSDMWDSDLYKEDGKYYIVSTITNSNSDNNKCVDNVSYCADYIVTIHFLVKETDKTSTSIGMDEPSALVMPMIERGKLYTKEYVLSLTTEISGNGSQRQTINISKAQSATTTTTPTPTASPSTSSEPTKEEPKEETTSSTIQGKSNNNYLKSLEIENYEIEFKKEKKRYRITVEEEVNSVNVKAATEDEKATYQIIGADDIKGNNKQIEIVVTAEDGEKKTYSIEVNYNHKIVEEEKTVPEEKPKQEKKAWKPTEKEKQMIIIGGSLFVILILIIAIINFRGNRKIDKALDKM